MVTYSCAHAASNWARWGGLYGFGVLSSVHSVFTFHVCVVVKPTQVAALK